jgi:nucleotide-binding universal stress UspA family protein
MLCIGADNSPDDSARISEEIARVGTSLSRFSKSEVHVLHAWTPYGESIMAKRLSGDDLFNYVEAEKNAAAEYVDSVVKSLGISDSSRQLIEGNPATVIPAFASDGAHDLLVLGSAARTGIRGFFLGNTAESILDNLECSCLVIKPNDFESPIA